MIYFIRETQSGLVKIGFSKSPNDRLRSLQTGHAFVLELVGTIAGTMAQERKLHKRFGDLRVRGEWFRAVGALSNLDRELPSLEPAPHSLRVALSFMAGDRMNARAAAIAILGKTKSISMAQCRDLGLWDGPCVTRKRAA